MLNEEDPKIPSDPETSDGEPVGKPEKGESKPPSNIEKPNLYHRKLRAGLPAVGSTHEPGAEIAAGAAGARSGIEQASAAGHMKEFAEKYARFYDGDPNRLIRAIEQLDELPSDQASSRIATINGILGKIHSKARQHFKKQLAEKLWPQKFPKHKEEELRKFVFRAKRSDLYQSDANARERVDRLISALDQFDQEIEEKIGGQPEAKELDADYSLLVGGRKAAMHYGKALSQTAKSGEEGEKQIGKIYKKGGWSDPNPELVPKPRSDVAMTPKWAPKAGQNVSALGAGARQASLDDIDKEIKKITAKLDDDPFARISRGDQEKLADLRARRTKLTGAKGPTIHKRAASEAIDRFMDQILEIAGADRKPSWIDDL